ncbi:Translocon-associated protein subunit alpha [Myotis brandtii]|uniref:Translocon-associated protein subunit alpha n=1 Tax=Myotis brandtii TaxID=109478 RepID=S7NKG1_MYOBR|nr:Translocon-associated protein subunit alpha [Myotis brandtii]
MRLLPCLLLLLLLVFPATLLLRGGPGGSVAAAQDLTEDEETVEDSIIEDEDDEAEVEEDEPIDLAEDKEEKMYLVNLKLHQDYQFYIQYFTALPLNTVVPPQRQATFEYSFIPAEPMGGQPFGLVINLNYKDLNGNVFQDAVFNQTVTIIEREDGLDGETIFMYMFLAGLGLLVVVGLHQLLESRKRKRPVQKVEMGTTSQNDVDMSWIPQETLNQINKASPRRLPRKRAQKSVGSDDTSGMFSSENLNVWRMEKSTICSKSSGLLMTFVGNAYKLTGLELTGAQCTLKGTVACEAAVGTEAGLSSSPVPPPSPSCCGPCSPVCWQPRFRSHHSQVLMVQVPLAPADGAEKLGPVPAVGASSSYCSDHPQEQGEVEKPSGAIRASSYRSHLLNSTEKSGPALGTGSGCEQLLQHWQ